jgi:hypothetical protein
MALTVDFNEKGEYEVFDGFTASTATGRRERKRVQERRGYLQELLKKFDGFEEAKPATRGIESESYKERHQQPDPISDLKDRGSEDDDDRTMD